MTLNPEFTDRGDLPSDSSSSARDEQMAVLMSHELPVAPQLGEETFIPDLDHQTPDLNAIDHGSGEWSIAEVVYAFGYVAAWLAYQRKLLTYSPTHDADFDPFAPFCPPPMQEAVDAVRNASRLQRGRTRINAMGEHVLNLVLDGTKPDVYLLDRYNAIGAGAYAMANINAIHAKREAFEQAMAEEARILATPAPETSDALKPAFTLNDAPAIKREALTTREILAVYENGVDGYNTKTKKVDLKQFPVALRLVAIQNVVAAHLDSLGELGDDVRLYTLEEAEQLLADPNFDKKRGVVQLVGGVAFNPRIKLLSVIGKDSLDAKFNVPGLTRNVVHAALALAAEAEQRPLSTPHVASTEPAEGELSPSVTSTTEEAVFQGADRTAPPAASSHEVALGWFTYQLAALLRGNLPDKETIQALYEAIASYDVSRDASIVGRLFNYNHTLGRAEAFGWIAGLRGEMRKRPPNRGQHARSRVADLGTAPSSRPTFAARTGARRRNSSAHVQQQPRRR